MFTDPPLWFDTNVAGNVLGVCAADSGAHFVPPSEPDFKVVEDSNVSYNAARGTWMAIIPAGQNYVDVTVKALDDSDTDEESVFLKVTTAYGLHLTTNANNPAHCFKLISGGTSEDFVLIKDAGWAVKSVEWQQNANGNELFGTWTGRSVYADSDTPNPVYSDYRNVDVVVTVEGLLPVNGGVVVLDCLDPPNASNTGAANYDGTSIFHLGTSSFAILTFYNLAPFCPIPPQTITTKVGSHAGDNYIIAATADNGKPDNVVKSEILTVWRRLWVECDFVKVIIDPDIPPIPLPSPEGYLDHARQELERACVKIELYDNPNPSPVYPSNDPMTDVQLAAAVVVLDPIQHPNASNLTNRDLPRQSTPEFWTVRILMTPELESIIIGGRDVSGDAGFFLSGGNTIILNYPLLSKSVSEWNAKPENINKQVELEKRIARTLLHELCHCLIDGNENDIYFFGNGIYNEAGEEYEDGSSFGVRETFWIGTPFDKASDAYWRTWYSWLTTLDIRDIQEHSMANN